MSDHESVDIGVKSTPERPLGFRLFDQRHYDSDDDDDFYDITDLVFKFRGGYDDYSAPAHKTVLYVASKILKTMIQRRLDDKDLREIRRARKSTGGCFRPPTKETEVVTIKIPVSFAEEHQEQAQEAIEIFFKCIYTEQRLESTVDLRMLIAVLQLANYFGVEGLIENCFDLLGKRVEKDFVLIFETTLPLQKSGYGVCEMAFGMVKRNLKDLLNGAEMLHWRGYTWRSLLVRSEPLDVDEFKLFDAMMRWKEHDVDNRELIFKHLIKCIRFWMMEATTIADKVEKTGILSKGELADFFVFFSSGSRVSHAKSAEELHRLLGCVLPGSVIVLEKHIYEGTFLLTTNEIKIIGQGSESVIKGKLMIDANGCQIDGMKFETVNKKPIVSAELDDTELVLDSPSPPYKKLKKDGHEQTYVVSISGNSNRVKNVSIFGNESNSFAIICRGNENTLTCIHTNIPSIEVNGNLNIVELLTCFQVRRGLVINGDENKIFDIVWFPHICDQEPSEVGVLVTGGKRNELENICYFHYPPVSPPEWIMLKIEEDTEDNTIQNCAIGCGSVFLDGKRHKMDNVVIPPHFSLKLRGRDHELRNCYADDLHNVAPGTGFEECDFADYNE